MLRKYGPPARPYIPPSHHLFGCQPRSMFALSRCLRPTNFPVATISPHCIVKAGTAHDRVFVVPSLFGSETAQLLSDPVFEDSVKFVESCSTRPAAVDRCSQSSAGMAGNFSPACTRHRRTHRRGREISTKLAPPTPAPCGQRTDVQLSMVIRRSPSPYGAIPDTYCAGGAQSVISSNSASVHAQHQLLG